MCVEGDRERERDLSIYDKELAHRIMEVGKSQIFRVDKQAEDPGEYIFQ